MGSTTTTQHGEQPVTTQQSRKMGYKTKITIYGIFYTLWTFYDQDGTFYPAQFWSGSHYTLHFLFFYHFHCSTLLYRSLWVVKALTPSAQSTNFRPSVIPSTSHMPLSWPGM